MKQAFSPLHCGGGTLYLASCGRPLLCLEFPPACGFSLLRSDCASALGSLPLLPFFLTAAASMAFWRAVFDPLPSGPCVDFVPSEAMVICVDH